VVTKLQDHLGGVRWLCPLVVTGRGFVRNEMAAAAAVVTIPIVELEERMRKPELEMMKDMDGEGLVRSFLVPVNW